MACLRESLNLDRGEFRSEGDGGEISWHEVSGLRGEGVRGTYLPFSEYGMLNSEDISWRHDLRVSSNPVINSKRKVERHWRRPLWRREGNRRDEGGPSLTGRSSRCRAASLRNAMT